MSRVLWIDATAGVAGDMLLGALLDAGASEADVRAAVAAVAGDAVRLEPRQTSRAGLRALQVSVHTAEAAPRRTWRDVRELLERAALAEPVRDRARQVFTALADAEARVHGISADEVHFHEVGALDALADVVGCCAAYLSLGVDEVVASPIAVGSGAVRTAHGVLPVPVPAVVELLRGAPTQAGGEGELATPTGAALLATLADRWGGQPPMRVCTYGVGAGSRDTPDRPNVVRALVGAASAGTEADSEADSEADTEADTEADADADAGGVVSVPVSAELVLETNVDDMDPRLWPAVLARLLAAGASDAWLTPVLMKKGRPAHTLSVLVAEPAADAVRRTVFRETSSIGLRETRVAKHALARREARVEVDGQPVRVKLAVLDGEVVNAQPEWDDVVAAAAALSRPAKAVLAAAVGAAHRLPAG